jgi:preprotein translocase subunit SecD
MKGNNGLKFVLVIISIAVLTWICLSGTFGGDKIYGSVNNIKLGIDIKGGVDARLYAVTKTGTVASMTDLENAKTIIEKRLDYQQIFDRVVAVNTTNGYLVVQIPYGDKTKDPVKTLTNAVKTALLTFQEVDENKKDTNGDYLPTGKIILYGKDVQDAKVQTDPDTNEIGVSLTLKPSGTKAFADATSRLMNKPIAIFMDNHMEAAPFVRAHITNGQASIDGGYTAATAGDLAATIRSGSLPFKLETKQISTISPTLGESSLNVSVTAALFALVLVWLFMLIMYRLPGMLANIALLAHTVLQLLFISMTGITVTLPGIAGIILTIGMGVDANIIIFARIKEELRNGKTLRAAVDVGFKKAFTAVLDANMTTLISAVVLYGFGTGPIKSFALTLGLGVALSFLTAVVVSRIMLKSVVNVNIAKHHWLYGISTPKDKENDTKEAKA